MDDQTLEGIINAIRPIDIQELPAVIKSVDIGTVNYKFIEAYKRQVPKFGNKSHSMMVRHTFNLEPVKSLNDYVINQFIDNETRKVKLTPLPFDEAVAEFAAILIENGRTPTHVVDLGNNIFAVIASNDMQIRVGLHNNKVVAALVNTFDQFPVFRMKP
jgi:hypothetical protein